MISVALICYRSQWCWIDIYIGWSIEYLTPAWAAKFTTTSNLYSSNNLLINGLSDVALMWTYQMVSNFRRVSLKKHHNNH